MVIEQLYGVINSRLSKIYKHKAFTSVKWYQFCKLFKLEIKIQHALDVITKVYYKLPFPPFSRILYDHSLFNNYGLVKQFKLNGVIQ